MKMNSIKMLALGTITSVLLSGCAMNSLQTVSVEGVKPATNPSVLKYDEIFVDEFENDHTGITSAVEEALKKKRINGKEVFEVTSFIDADVIIKGRVNDEKIRDWKYTKTRYICGDINCTRMVEVEDNCLKREIATNVTFKALKKDTNEVLISKTYFKTEAMRMCDREDTNFVQSDKVLFNMHKDLSTQFVNYISPNYYSMRVDIVEEEPIIDLSSKQEDLIKRANAFLKQKVLSKATELYSEVLKEQPNSYVANFNLGVVAEVEGNFEKAKEQYLRCTHLIKDKTKNPELMVALNRVQKVLAEKTLTTEQLN